MTSIAAALFVLCVAAPPVSAAVPLVAARVIVDGRSAGKVGSFHVGDVAYVDLDATARIAGIPSTLHRGVRSFVVGNDVYEVRSEDRRVTERGRAVLLLSTKPLTRAGGLYVTPDDLSSLLGIGADLEGLTLVLTSPRANGGARVTEIPVAPSANPPAVVPAALRPASAAAPARYGSLNLMLSNVAGVPLHALAADVNGETVRANAYFDGIGNETSLSGGVATFGTADHNVTIGDVGDPLNGIVFRSGVAYGGALVNGQGNARYADAVRRGGGAVVAATKSHDGNAAELALVTCGSADNGSGSSWLQPLAGWSSVMSSSLGTYRREAWLGTGGLAAGASVRTRGKVWVEADLDAAGAGLPLKPGDAPLRMDVGDAIAPGIVLDGGFYGGRATSAGGFVNATGRLRHGTASAGWQAGEASANVSLSGAASSGFAAYYRYRGASIGTAQADVQRGTGAYELRVQMSSASFADASVQWASNRGAAGPLLGVEWLHSGVTKRAGPVAGVRFALGPTTDVQAAVHPMVSGYGVRFGIAQRFRLPEHRTAASTRVTVVGFDPAMRLQVEIDGVAVATEATSSFALDVPAGDHYVSVVTGDGATGSPPVLVRGASAVTLPLWPIRSIAGRVVITAPPAIAAGLTLQGTAVELAPSGLVALVNPDGTFSFERAPVDPSATLSIVASSLPPSLVAGRAVSVFGAQPIVLEVLPAQKVEKKVFPGG